MKFDEAILRRAEERIRDRRRHAEDTSERRRQSLQEKLPQLSALQAGIASGGTKLIRTILRKDEDAKEQIEKIREENLFLQEQVGHLLASEGLPPDYLKSPYTCTQCSDEGYIDGKMCECLKLMIKQCSYERLNTSIPLAGYTFDRFSLEYYENEPDKMGVSPRMRMEKNFRYCKQYAEKFTPGSDSLLMQGATGLGKTHLSLAIAGAVIEKGYGVIYGSIQNLIAKIEKEKFGRDSEEDTLQNLLGCDLLILDDLGTEFLSAFVLSAIHNLINTRLLSGKPTIISTNLSTAELEDKYGERIVSRMIGGYQVLYYAGGDVRQKKRFRILSPKGES